MNKNPLDKLANIGEELLGKASQSPAATRAIQGAMQMKERVDDLSKRVRGLEGMEKRLAALEKRLDKLEKPKPSSSSSSSKSKSKTKSATKKS